MLQAVLGEVLLRQVPASLLSGVRSGDLQVYGSIIRSVTNGRVVGHLQETAGLANLVGKALAAPAALPLQAAGLGVDAVGHTVSYVQNEQIKAAVATLQNLQIANLALGAAGIGVSVAGFAVLSAKIGRVEAKVDQMADQLKEIGRGIEALRQDRITDDLIRLRTAVEQMEEGWSLADPVHQWRNVAQETHGLANGFERRALEVLDNPEADQLTAEPFLDALALAGATRVSARLASGDEVAARQAAAEIAAALVKLGSRLRLSELTLARLRRSKVEPGAPGWGESLDKVADELRPVMKVIQQREATAATATLTLAELEAQQISGRAWLEAARSEEDEPLLYLAPRAT